MSPARSSLLLALILAASTLAACGQKGALYLPTAPKAKVPASAGAAQGSPAAPQPQSTPPTAPPDAPQAAPQTPPASAPSATQPPSA